MKKISYILTLLTTASTLLLSSCAKEKAVGIAEGELVECTLQAEVAGTGGGLEIDTKVALNSDGVTPNWESGDQILVLDADKKPVGADGKFTLSSGAGTASATFKGKVKSGQVPTYAIYPVSVYDAATGSFTLSATQDGTMASAFKKAVMLGKISESTTTFTNACAVLTFNTGDYGKSGGDPAIKSVKVSASCSSTPAPLAGNFNINWTATPPTITAAGTGTVSELTIELPSTLWANDKDIYIPIFPQSAATSMEYEFTNASGIPAEVSYNFSAAIAGGILKDLGTAQGMEFKIPDWMTGVFSISSTKKVVFSKGNLYYDGSEFKFEENQTDSRSIGGYNAYIGRQDTVTPDGHYGLFFFHRSPEGAMADEYPMVPNPYYMITTDQEYTYDLEESDNLFAHNMTICGKQSYVLDRSEWEYLSNSNRMKNAGIEAYISSDYDNRFIIEGEEVVGTFFFPDEYNGPQNIGETGLSTWKEIYDAGVLFMGNHFLDNSFGGIFIACIEQRYRYWTRYPDRVDHTTVDAWIDTFEIPSFGNILYDGLWPEDHILLIRVASLVN